MISSVISIVTYRWLKREFELTNQDMDTLKHQPEDRDHTIIDPDYSKLKCRSPHFFTDEIGIDDLAIFFQKADSQLMVDNLDTLSDKLYEFIYGFEKNE